MNSNADSFTFTLDDGVVTSGVIDALGDTLTLTVDTAGVLSVVDIAIPALLTHRRSDRHRSNDRHLQLRQQPVEPRRHRAGCAGHHRQLYPWWRWWRRQHHVRRSDGYPKSVITADECVQGNSSGNALEFGSCGTGSGAALSNETPTTVDEGGAEEGTDSEGSRSDHDHQFGDASANILDSVAGIDAKLADMSIENASRTWTTLVSVADGGFVSVMRARTTYLLPRLRR